VSEQQWEGLRGYRPLRPGRIHLLCPLCGRKMSNIPRADYDPKQAALCVIPCDKHSGLKVEGGEYFDKRGNPFVFDGERYRVLWPKRGRT
jgi:hypothetical protein